MSDVSEQLVEQLVQFRDRQIGIRKAAEEQHAALQRFTAKWNLMQPIATPVAWNEMTRLTDCILAVMTHIRMRQNALRVTSVSHTSREQDHGLTASHAQPLAAYGAAVPYGLPNLDGNLSWFNAIFLVVSHVIRRFSVHSPVIGSILTDKRWFRLLESMEQKHNGGDDLRTYVNTLLRSLTMDQGIARTAFKFTRRDRADVGDALRALLSVQLDDKTIPRLNAFTEVVQSTATACVECYRRDREDGEMGRMTSASMFGSGSVSVATKTLHVLRIPVGNETNPAEGGDGSEPSNDDVVRLADCIDQACALTLDLAHTCVVNAEHRVARSAIRFGNAPGCLVIQLHRRRPHRRDILHTRVKIPDQLPFAWYPNVRAHDATMATYHLGATISLSSPLPLPPPPPVNGSFVAAAAAVAPAAVVADATHAVAHIRLHGVWTRFDDDAPAVQEPRYGESSVARQTATEFLFYFKEKGSSAPESDTL